MRQDQLTIENALNELSAATGEAFVSLFKHGSSLEVEIYAPQGIDLQQPHSKDEIYIIAKGSGWFVNAEQRHQFEAGQVLFVPAGQVHRFEDFSDDFATWVIFYGPEGGEESNKDQSSINQNTPINQE